MSARDPLLVKSVEKAVRILSAFSNGQPTMSLADVAALTGLDKSGSQRFTHTLVQLGLLRKDPDTKRFELTARVLEFGANYTRSNALVRAAAPHLLNLSKTTEEAVSLTVLDDVDIVYIQRFVSRNMLTTDVITGTRLPVYCTAPGLALLSGMPRSEALAIIQRCDRKPITPKTRWAMDEIAEQLELTAEHGYALVVDQIYLNDISVAAPVFGANGRSIAAVSIGVSKLRCTPEEACERFAPLLITVAEALSHGRLRPQDVKKPRT